MRKISADYIFPISSKPIKNGVIVLDYSGVILDIREREESDAGHIEIHKGFICPGFINTHCHLELSHMRGKVPEGLGIAGFIKHIVTQRNSFSDEAINQAIIDAENEMLNNGIVAVGDISNNESTFEQKAKNNLYYHTFIEAFDLGTERTKETFENALLLKEKLKSFSLPGSIVPHAPYTVSDNLLKLISHEASMESSIQSIHSQESEAENDLFISKSGALYELFTELGINMDFIQKTGKNSLQSTLPKLASKQNILLVHNTLTNYNDIDFANSISKNNYWCTCPNANIYIENKLPNYQYFIDKKCKVTIGTDSLSSNWSLSVLDELKTISKNNPNIPLETLLLWATRYGAEFFNLPHLGAIEKGKKPGLNLLQNTDNHSITKDSTVKVLA